MRLKTKLGPYSLTILKNILCLFLQEFVNLKVTTSDWLNHNGLASQKLCYFKIILIIQRDVFVKHECPRNINFFSKTETLTDDLDFGTKERVLPQGIFM